MFALLLTDHPLWKYTLKPAILQDTSGETFPLDTYLSSDNRYSFDLNEQQSKVMDAYDTTSETYVMKLFVREKMSKVDFQKKFGSSFPNYDLILNSIEHSLYKIAKLAVEFQIPIFLKKKGFTNIYSYDRIVMSPRLDTTVSSFVLENGVLLYSLLLSQQEKTQPIPILNFTKDLYLLSHEPCCMILKNKLYVFSETNFKKIQTFFHKKFVEVPVSSLETYMNTFVKKTLLTENPYVQGFSVSYPTVEPHPILFLTEDLNSIAVLKVRFRYLSEIIDYDYSNNRLVTLRSSDNDFNFEVIERDLTKEKFYIDFLKELGLHESNLYFHIDYKKNLQYNSIVDFLINFKEKLSEFEIQQDLQEKTYVLESVSYYAEFVEIDLDWFELRGNVKVGDFDIPFVKLRNHILDGRREYQLPNGKIILLPEELFTRFSDLMILAVKDKTLRFRRSMIGMLEDKFATARNIHMSLKEPEDIPSNVHAVLRPYQIMGYSWLMKLYRQDLGGCLADDMGLGKTLQFLTFLRAIYPQTELPASSSSTKWIYETSEPSLFDQPIELNSSCQPESVQPCVTKAPSLIVLPTSLLFNWVSEKTKFTPSLSHYVYAGEHRVHSSQIGKIFSHYQLVFTTYGILRNDIDILKNVEFDCVIMDESQNLKNPSSQIYKAVMELKARHFFCMTGTPIENGMMDLWAQMNLINRDILGSQNNFHHYFEQPILKEQNGERNALFRQIIKPFIMRRTKKEVVNDLPEKFCLEVYCEMSDEHKLKYDSNKSAVRNSLMDEILRYGKPQDMTLAFSSLTLLRQMANQVSLVEPECDIASSKVDEIIRRLISLKEEGHKVLIFSNFVKFLEVIENKVQQLGYGYSKIIGATKDREKEVYRFQNDENTFCFLISLKSGGVGLNLTAADYVFLIDPWWNPAAEQQAEDRAYRIGQLKNVFVYRFIMKETIEEKVLLLQKNKKSIADSFINQNNPFDTFDKSDWENLLR